MSVTYTYDKEPDKRAEDPKDRLIVASETVTQTKEQKFTIANYEDEIARLEQRKIDIQTKIDELKAEIDAAVVALNITLEE